ncbi:MAG TPA: DUF3298 and DUF4163 domain-containing protein [Oscillospiraceae bacterium]|nr:DUF3298 and DUF4163 domain-containing protein [Oscillospiraceae bacterium]
MKNCTNAKIVMKDLAHDFICKDILMVAFSSSYPCVSLKKQSAQSKINKVIKSQVEGFFNYVKTTLFSQAKEEYDYAMENNFPFRPFEAVLNYTVTYNACNLLSMYRDSYEYTGGAHGSTLRQSNTFDITRGNCLSLSDFFYGNPCHHEYIIKQIIKQADKNMSENPYIYFENYKELIRENFNPKSFYLTNDGIVIYFQQYEIAPYSTGIVEFTVNFCNDK